MHNLTLYQNRLNNLQPDIFINLQQLKLLNIQQNRIEILPAIQGATLDIFEFHNNANLSAISENMTFHSNNTIKEIRTENTILGTFPQNFFVNLSKLEVLTFTTLL